MFAAKIVVIFLSLTVHSLQYAGDLRTETPLNQPLPLTFTSEASVSSESKPITTSELRNYLKQGDLLIASDKFDEAMQAYDKAIALDPHCEEAFYGKGKVLSHYTSEADKAIEAFNKASELNPYYAEAYFEKGKIFSNTGKVDKAIQAYDKAIQLKPDFADAFYEKGSILEVTGSTIQMEDPGNEVVISNFSEAIQALNRAIELKPNFAKAHFIKGIALMQLDKYNDAIETLNKAIELDPRNTQAYIQKARSLERLALYDEAIQTLDKATGAIPSEELDVIYYEKAMIYAADLNDAEKAIENLKQCLEINWNYIKVAGAEEKFKSLKKLREFQMLFE
ncbi:tetratricopeptide repeat protein [Paenibacillus elgii]|uniref:tetratricopeptide repeat protein n=1 Tax=Paenibacillus elgii TaxID=189691 RepID=UPI000FD70455|nr:tetratricopeptide repeat protein [Paenibacillus elgii]NEN80893.1 tetratricopeptide repeat protein [Paenibacillus elgii]